ncbi:lipopolysaccharide biosynthesis protein [Leptothrix cholodnii SP-6]|uniref:Lipopolysaccharide biosynthesis protein n=1 Tax=Leptothrix cholodnii (strain ATCC 51168 / LMG 8142 / SP-6) TaxID=395495 RepID=B1XZS2_LEPCP|nr:Wzz/FepE/Etk N-terminal domain-containing protein [Leptothrix cholodnii]ACB32918.1 lipopolysaccharide biosynthesis protein [Leptothrix cholodnii SP-6]
MSQITQQTGADTKTGNVISDMNASEELSLIDVLLILSRRKLLLVVAPLLVGCAALGMSYLVRPTYTASVQLLPPQQQQSGALTALLGAAGGMASALGGISGLKNPSDQWIGMLKSRAIVDAIVNEFSLREIYEVEYQFKARERLEKNSRIVAGKDGLIDIEVDDHDPERAAKIATAYVDELQNLMRTLAVTEAAQRRLFFEKQLSDTKTKLIKAEILLTEGGINTGVLKTNPEAAVSQLAQAQAAVTAQEVKVSVMRESMTNSNPQLRNAILELASLREQLHRSNRDEPERAKGSGAEYVTRFRDFKYYETLFDLFARQYEMARADEARDGSVIQVIDPAQVPEYKSGPKRGMIAVLATILTFILSVLYVLASHALRGYTTRADGRLKMDALKQAIIR